jgi:hypothetical protein
MCSQVIDQNDCSLGNWSNSVLSGPCEKYSGILPNYTLNNCILFHDSYLLLTFWYINHKKIKGKECIHVTIIFNVVYFTEAVSAKYISCQSVVHISNITFLFLLNVLICDNDT